MNINEIYQRALDQIRCDTEAEFQNEFKTLLEKRSKAKLVLDNIDREIEEKKLEVSAKIDSIMSSKLPGVQSNDS